jgi:nickel-dependent lactate racemase
MVTAIADRVVYVPWASWFEDSEFAMHFPDAWQVELCASHDGADIGEAGILAAFDQPIGTPRIRDLAAGKRSAAVVVDDLSRPTPAHRLLPPLLDELAEAGISREHVVIVIGVANHRQLTREEMAWKVGREIVDSMLVRNHFSWDDCVDLGRTRRGTPVHINRLVMEADFKVLVGGITPHGAPGFAGGAKLLAPGVAGIATARALHGPGGPRGGLAQTATEFRLEVEECARLAGVDAIVNAVMTRKRGIAHLVVGDVVAAHRAGVEVARRTYGTPVPSGVDVCVLTAFPKDTEYAQISLAFNVWNTAAKPIAHEQGTVVVCTAASEGAGFHSLMGPGMALGQNYPQSSPRRAVAPRDMIVFSPGINVNDLSPAAREDVTFCNSWVQVMAALQRKHGDRARVAVFPCSAMQVAENATS